MVKAWIPPPKTVGGCMVRLGPNRGVMERILELTSKRRHHEKTDHKFPSYPGKFGKFSKLKTALGVGDMWSFTWRVSIKKSEKSQKKYHTPYIFGQLLAQHGFWPIWVSRDHPDDHTPQGWCNEFQLRFLNLLNQYYHGYIVDPEWKNEEHLSIFFSRCQRFSPKKSVKLSTTLDPHEIFFQRIAILPFLEHMKLFAAAKSFSEHRFLSSLGFCPTHQPAQASAHPPLRAKQPPQKSSDSWHGLIATLIYVKTEQWLSKFKRCCTLMLCL